MKRKAPSEPIVLAGAPPAGTIVNMKCGCVGAVSEHVEGGVFVHRTKSCPDPPWHSSDRCFVRFDEQVKSIGDASSG
jgi:hypothetical protein